MDPSESGTETIRQHITQYIRPVSKMLLHYQLVNLAISSLR